GTAKQPQCDGILLSDIDNIDWQQVDLSEWLGILQQHGKFRDPAALNLDTLTGQGNDLNINDDRQNAQQRAVQRLDGINVDQIRTNVTDQMAVPTGKP
ncbi:MAG: hypothetical protein ACRCUH_05530, partial [Shewanella sp.]